MNLALSTLKVFARQIRTTWWILRSKARLPNPPEDEQYQLRLIPCLLAGTKAYDHTGVCLTLKVKTGHHLWFLYVFFLLQASHWQMQNPLETKAHPVTSWRCSQTKWFSTLWSPGSEVCTAIQFGTSPPWRPPPSVRPSPCRGQIWWTALRPTGAAAGCSASCLAWTKRTWRSW